jgi:hypothetical protein
VRFDDAGRVTGTAEKQVVSNFAIAGCYLFADVQTFADGLAAYRSTCSYDELFISGIYNSIVHAGGEVAFHELDQHVAFGTPEEYRRVREEDLSFLVTEPR